MTTIYQRIVEAGIPYANHESDLYVPDTPEVRAIIAEHDASLSSDGRTVKTNCFPFINQAKPHAGERWLDIAFFYDPWWDARLKS